MVSPDAPFESVGVCGMELQKEHIPSEASLTRNQGKRFTSTIPCYSLTENQAKYLKERAKLFTKRIPQRLQREFNCGPIVNCADYVIIEEWEHFDVKSLPARNAPRIEIPNEAGVDIDDELRRQQAERGERSAKANSTTKKKDK